MGGRGLMAAAAGSSRGQSPSSPRPTGAAPSGAPRRETRPRGRGARCEHGTGGARPGVSMEEGSGVSPGEGIGGEPRGARSQAPSRAARPREPGLPSRPPLRRGVAGAPGARAGGSGASMGPRPVLPHHLPELRGPRRPCRGSAHPLASGLRGRAGLGSGAALAPEHRLVGVRPTRRRGSWRGEAVLGTRGGKELDPDFAQFFINISSFLALSELPERVRWRRRVGWGGMGSTPACRPQAPSGKAALHPGSHGSAGPRWEPERRRRRREGRHPREVLLLRPRRAWSRRKVGKA